MVNSTNFDKLKMEIQAALANEEFHVYLQPKVSMITERVYGAEALSRWIHPIEGIRRPDTYIPILEESGLIVQLDMYIFEEVCKLKQRWYEAEEEFAGVPISVNMSRLHLYRKGFVEELLEITARYHVSPDELELEITESVYLNDFSELVQVVSRLQKGGFLVSIDDFGSGYSALSMLKDIPVDIIKIDKEFLQLSTNSERGKKVIKNIIILCKELKLKVVVEGVETTEQIQFLTSFGCEIAQGFYYSKPVSVADFEAYIREHLVVSIDIIKFRFQDTLMSERGRFEGVYTGESCQYVRGITPNTRAIHFVGGNARENCLSLPADIIHNDSYSVAMWVKVDRLNSWTAIVFGEYENGFFQFCPLSEKGFSCFRIRDRRGVDAWYDAESEPLEVGKWYHIVITYDRMEERAVLFKNGQCVSTCENVPAIYFPKRLLIGSDIYKNTFEGDIGEVIFYDRALNKTEVAQLFEEYLSMEGFDAF